MATKKKKLTTHVQTDATRQSFAKRADRLKSEINDIEEFLFNIRAKDPYLRFRNLETFRIEIFRSFVISLHLAMEDLLRALLFDFVARQNRRLTKKETIRMVDQLRSAELIRWCGHLKLLTPLQYKNLLELNRIRNACAHNWILDLHHVKRIGPKGKKRNIRIPAVEYLGKSLFAGQTFTDEFVPIYGRLYLKLLFRVWKIQGKL